MKPSSRHGLLSCAAIAALLIIGCGSDPSKISFEGKVGLAEAFEPGVPKQEIIKVLGEPNEVSTKPEREVLTWRHPNDGYGTIVLNFEKGAFTMGGAFLKGQKGIRLGSARKN